MLCLLLLISCNGTNKSGAESVNEDDSKSIFRNDVGPQEVAEYYVTEKENDSVRNQNSQPQDTILSEGEPDLTKLPINTHELFMSNRMMEFIDQSPEIYRLPSKKKQFLVPIYGYYRNRVKEFCVSSNKLSKIKIDSIFNFTSYRYKLPDIYNYKAFIVSNLGWSDYRVEVFHYLSCGSFIHSTSAYLLLYDTISNNLNIIELFCWNNNRQFSGRTFDIDKKFVITLKDYGLFVDYDIEDENGNPFAEYKITNIYKVYILENGSIKVDFPKMYGFKYDDKDTAWGVRDSIDPMTIIYQINGEIDTLSKI